MMAAGLILALLRSGAIRPAIFEAMTTLAPRTDDALEAAVRVVAFIPCRSRLHEGRPLHEADWHMRCPCGGVVAVCDERRDALLLSDGFHCNPITCRCPAFHRFAEITWTRI